MSDRNYYRTEDDNRLIEEAKYNPNAELAIALGERLENYMSEAEAEIDEWRDRAADLERDCNRLDDKIYELQAEIDKLELMLGERDRVIDEMKKGN
jgi:phage shock protein A